VTDVEAKRLADEIDDRVIRLQPLLSGLQPRARVLEIARFLLGTCAIVEPTGNNDGVPRFLFMDGEWDEVNGRGLPWCAAFAVYCYCRALHSIPGNKYLLRSCAVILEKAKELGALLPAGTLPEPGDIVLLYGRRGSDPLSAAGVHHCGIVESVDAEQVYSIEGNWGNKLAHAKRALSDPAIAGYARF